MHHYATAVALLCLQTACATPHASLAAASSKLPTPEQAAAPIGHSQVETKTSLGPGSDMRKERLFDALRQLSSDPRDLSDLRVFFAFADLNDDGVDEAVVHVTGAAFCGTGGCNTMVYQWDALSAAYAQIDNSPTTRPPIYVAPRRGCQWSTLWVNRSGGGRATERHSPLSLRGGEGCDAAVGEWQSAESVLLIPAYQSRDEGNSL